jgi:hypothetical protein
MKLLPLCASWLAPFLFLACASAPTATTAPAPAAASDKPDAKPQDGAKKDDDAAKAKADAKKQKQKELRGKQRELEAAAIENQVAELDRTVRQWSIDAQLAKTGAELDHAQRSLKVFLEEQKPRELEEKRIGFDQSTYYAEHQKDELGELTAMYDADEFARTTKELVLKRGRRSLEMAERSLAIARRELTHFESIVLPQRERELRQKLADAELERKKAEVEANKAKIEFEQALKKARFRQADLTEDIAELEKALAEDKS